MAHDVSEEVPSLTVDPEKGYAAEMCTLVVYIVTLGELSSAEIKLPLILMCRATGTQRNVQYKLTFESSETALEVGDLMPEFEAEKSTSIAFQPVLSDSVVSIFVSPKSKRYRIQSDSLDELYVFAEELISRVKSKQPEVSLSCHVPLDHILQRLHIYLEVCHIVIFSAELRLCDFPVKLFPYVIHQSPRNEASNECNADILWRRADRGEKSW
uniref:PTHB1 C-terminal domain-containing protein n=1 Tax=Parascaris equorum TaxID=6256 RepID=A0A914R7T9_PAREQ